MSITHWTTAGVTLLGALAIGAAGDAGDAVRCSIMPFASGLGSQETLLFGSASPDTVRAGAGAVSRSRAGGPDERQRSGPIFGQVVDVARYAGADSVALARAFERSDDARVIIVPWDYDGACQPVRWAAGAAWVPVAQPVVFTVRLRPDSLWAGGVLTFDAFFALFEPYPLGEFYHRGYRGTDSLRTTPSLTSAEYFDLMREIPDEEALRAAPDSSWEAVVRWQAEHPGVARKFPAPRLIAFIARSIQYDKSRQALRAVEPVVAGTWRFTFSLDEDPARTFYARTRPRATTGWSDPGSERAAIDPLQPPSRPDGYHVLASGSLTPDSLPADCAGDRNFRREGYIAALDPPPLAGEARTEWVGLVDLRLLDAQFPADTTLSRYVREWMRGVGARSRATGRDTPARFTLGADGVLRVEQTVRFDDGRSVALRGERVSLAVTACDW